MNAAPFQRDFTLDPDDIDAAAMRDHAIALLDRGVGLG